VERKLGLRCTCKLSYFGHCKSRDWPRFTRLELRNNILIIRKVILSQLNVLIRSYKLTAIIPRPQRDLDFAGLFEYFERFESRT
jgi:hypothetical protein